MIYDIYIYAWERHSYRVNKTFGILRNDYISIPQVSETVQWGTCMTYNFGGRVKHPCTLYTCMRQKNYIVWVETWYSLGKLRGDDILPGVIQIEGYVDNISTFALYDEVTQHVRFTLFPLCRYIFTDRDVPHSLCPRTIEQWSCGPNRYMQKVNYFTNSINFRQLHRSRHVNMNQSKFIINTPAVPI